MKINKEILDNWTWSFSRVRSFKIGCPYGWYLRYVVPEYIRRDFTKPVAGFLLNRLYSAKDGNFFSDFGSLMHSLIDKSNKGDLDIFELVDVYKDEFETYVKHSAPPNKFVDLHDSYYQSGIEYFSNFDGFQNYEIEDSEKEINFEIGGHKFIGYIDMKLRDKKDNGLVLLDHKSKSKFTSKKEQHEYARQIYTYAIPSVTVDKEIPKELKFNMFRKGYEVTIPFKMKDYKEAQDWCKNTIDEIYNYDDWDKMIADSDDFYCSQLCEWRNSHNYKKNEDINEKDTDTE